MNVQSVSVEAYIVLERKQEENVENQGKRYHEKTEGVQLKPGQVGHLS